MFQDQNNKQAVSDHIESLLKQAFEQAIFEEKAIKRCGHVVRYVHDCHSLGGRIFPSIYTYGLTLDGFSHELECVLPFNLETAESLMNILVAYQRGGADFKPGQIYQLPDLNNTPFYFVETVQSGSDLPVYRIILADENHRLPQEEGCNPLYVYQELIGMSEELYC